MPVFYFVILYEPYQHFKWLKFKNRLKTPNLTQVGQKYDDLS